MRRTRQALLGMRRGVPILDPLCAVWLAVMIQGATAPAIESFIHCTKLKSHGPLVE
jgi:hypothetical protein